MLPLVTWTSSVLHLSDMGRSIADVESPHSYYAGSDINRHAKLDPVEGRLCIPLNCKFRFLRWFALPDLISHYPR